MTNTEQNARVLDQFAKQAESYAALIKDMLERVRRLYHADASAGSDAFGMHARIEDGQILVAYPMTMAVWLRTA